MYNEDILLLIKKLNPCIKNTSLKITHEDLIIMLRKRIFCHLTYVSKKFFPKLIANIIASFIPISFPKKESYHGIIDNQFCLIDVGITFDIYPEENFDNALWSTIWQQEHIDDYYEDALQQNYKQIDDSFIK